GSNQPFVAGLIERGLDFATEIRPSTRVLSLDFRQSQKRQEAVAARTLLRRGAWGHFDVKVPGATDRMRYHAADLGRIRLGRGIVGRLVAAQTGAIQGLHRGTVFLLTPPGKRNLKQLLQTAGWARWIRAAVRRQERESLRPSASR